MNNKRKHLFHLVNRSSRVFIISMFAFFFMTGFVFCLMNIKPIFFKGELLLLSFILILVNARLWYKEVITESTYSGYHTIIVQSGLTWGFLLFLVSEIMLFFGFFWAFFHVSLSPDISLGIIWPPVGIIYIEPLQIPLFNTILLLLSGFSLTWAHKVVTTNNIKNIIDSIIITLGLGLFFLMLQITEYYESYFSFNDSVYGSVFFMLTGLHGFHVLVGVTYIAICFHRYLNKHLTPSHHIGFLFAIW
jgi:heme/copper-type cytochrome/quinol oxidase subunit 3